jgi:DNA-binding CsgD family transcriptional regulator
MRIQHRELSMEHISTTAIKKSLSPEPEVVSCFRYAASEMAPNNDLLQTKHLLSSREHECLKLLAHGKTVKSIANCLGLSPRTVEDYLVRIKNKIGFNNKSQLADFYWSNYLN